MRTAVFRARVVSSLAFLGLLTATFAGHVRYGERSIKAGSTDPDIIVEHDGAFETVEEATKTTRKPRSFQVIFSKSRLTTLCY